ncbi:MAG: AraC family transcriptional regulator [Flavobacteriales bacterium]|nr:AraC family transcriptional regulator [Flavobacteriales bacterium]
MKNSPKSIPRIQFHESDERTAHGLEIKRIEELFDIPVDLDHDPFKAHRLAFFVIIFLESSHVKHQVDFEALDLYKGQALLLTKGQVHAFDAARNYKGTFVLFTEEFLDQHASQAALARFKRSFLTKTNVQAFDQSEHLQILLRLLTQSYAASSSGNGHLKLGALLTTLLLELCLQLPDQELGTSHTALFYQFLELHEQHFSDSRDANFYAGKLGVSYKHLNEVSKAITGLTIKAYIDEQLLLSAKRALVFGKQNAKEIAFELGFDEPSNFGKWFKKQSGFTPQQFRINNG